MRDSHYSPFLLLETPGFWELLWAPTPGPPLRFCPGDLTAPPDPQLARAMTFASRHDIIVNQQTFGGGGLKGGSHEIFTNREGGSTIFLQLPRGGGVQKFNRVFHPVSTTPLREVKNDNSLIIVRKHRRVVLWFFICLFSRKQGTKRTLLFTTFEVISWLQIPRLLKYGSSKCFPSP